MNHRLIYHLSITLIYYSSIGQAMRLSVITKDIHLERISLNGEDGELNFNSPLVITSTDINEITAEKIREANKNLTGRPYRFNGGLCYVFCDESFDFPEKPHGSNSGTSQARYLARRGRRFEGLLIQMLDSNKHTSKHKHKTQIEMYMPLEGRCFIGVDGKNYELMNHVLVQPHEVHQVSTRDEPSLAFIAMLGNEDSLSMHDHHYV